MEKTIGELIDELSIVNIKLYMIMENSNDLSLVRKLNRQRSDLKNAINKKFKEKEEYKTYD